ncbi:hypothetical protein ACSFA3_14430 [Variovorax sp. RHLX14]|uniref:hypothetical protein n=1 Tax=Variovorax sp. RHLX14 TaxID=1259731 RepID=UPI003F44F286
MEAIPIGIFWCIFVWISFQPSQKLIYFLFASMPFGSLAVLPTTITGGLTLTPTPAVAILLIVKVLGNAKGFRSAAADALRSSRLLFLFLFWVVAGITTAFMPRFFAGRVEVVPVRVEVLMDTALLVPTAQNISQFAYISISILTVFAFTQLLRSNELRRHVFSALCLGAFVTIISGLLDYTSQYISLDSVLDLFRTATYALLTTDEVLGGKRVVGLMPEASSFGSIALTFLTALYFFRRAITPSYLSTRIVPLLMAGLLISIWMSTSSAAYLGLGVLGNVAVLEWIARIFSRQNNPFLRRGIINEFYLGSLFLVGAMLLFLTMPKIFAPIQEMLDVMIFQKSTSSSFEERSMWTRVSWEALLTTGGLGVGLGGTRASNFAVSLFSNAGILGGALYIVFLVQCLIFRRVSSMDHEGTAYQKAIRWAYLPPFFAALTVGTTPDFGMFNAFFFGFSVALTSSRRMSLRPFFLNEKKNIDNAREGKSNSKQVRI